MNISELPANTPVLVAAATVRQKTTDLAASDEPWQLMRAAVEKAANDCGAASLCQSIDWIGVPQGFWQYSDPARLVADALGSSQARTSLAKIGITQQRLINMACYQIANGSMDVTVVTGGEAKYRTLQGKIQGLETPETEQVDVTPDDLLESPDILWSELEAERGLVMPTEFYALM